MGWASRLIALVLGLVTFGIGLWPFGTLCFLYLFFSFRPRQSRKGDDEHASRGRIPRRLFFAAGLFIISAIAETTGGTWSPIFFFFAGTVTLLWPLLLPRIPLSETVPVADSILLRSRYFRFDWAALAELKPGAEPFPRALSSFAGTLLVFTDTGKAYALATCRSSGREDAEEELLGQFRLSAKDAGAYLFPLDSGTAADVLRLKLSRAKVPLSDLSRSTFGVSGMLALSCSAGRVLKASAFEVDGPSRSASVHTGEGHVDSAPLVWEVLEAIGKRTRWPEPDPISNLLDSMAATRGVPIAERVKDLEGSGDKVRVHSLAGEEILISRPQLRALISVYA